MSTEAAVPVLPETKVNETTQAQQPATTSTDKGAAPNLKLSGAEVLFLQTMVFHGPLLSAQVAQSQREIDSYLHGLAEARGLDPTKWIVGPDMKTFSPRPEPKPDISIAQPGQVNDVAARAAAAERFRGPDGKKGPIVLK